MSPRCLGAKDCLTRSITSSCAAATATLRTLARAGGRISRLRPDTLKGLAITPWWSSRKSRVRDGHRTHAADWWIPQPVRFTRIRRNAMSLARYQASIVLILAVGLLILPMPASSQATDSAAAIRALVEFEEACQEATPLWPAELCGPIVMVDPRTRVAVANHPDPDGRFVPRDGAFVGEWPVEKPVANTGFDWEGTVLAMG